MTTAIIQFVGLLLFSYQFTPGQVSLQALAPRITAAPLGRGSIGTSIVDATVGEHATFIAFAKADYVSNKGWRPHKLTTTPGLLYVRLDGEQVEFTGAASNGGPKAADGLKLPHLAPCCMGGQDESKPTLKKEFRPPFSGAAAMFDLRAGRVQNCNGVIDGLVTDRADTVVEIGTARTLTISAKMKGKPAKWIKLRGGAHVLVGNLPVDAIHGGDPAASTAPHFNAYYAMIERAPKCASAHHCATSTSLGGPCQNTAVRQPGYAATDRPGRDIAVVGAGSPIDLPIIDVNRSEPLPLEAFIRIDFECSNSQWP